MDISFHTEEGRFNYRVCAVIVKGSRLLIMKDDALPYYYLPGGRVKLRETAEEALVREMSEELGAAVRPVRPLWLNQAFFTEAGAERQGSGLPYHSDEIARDSHPLPFYPPGRGRSPGGRHLLFSIQTR